MLIEPVNTCHSSGQEIEGLLLDREEETIAVCVAFLRIRGHDDAASDLERAFVDSDSPEMRLAD